MLQQASIISLKGFNLKPVNTMKRMRMDRYTYVECEAFSSNHRAWRMAARALCSTLMSTSEKGQTTLQSNSYHHNKKKKNEHLLVRGLQWSSGSSFRKLGGTVVMRIFTVASAELISKPVSLVSIDSTKADKGSNGTLQLYGILTAKLLPV